MQQVLRRLPGGSAGSQRAEPFPDRGTACPEPAALPLVPELEAAGVDQCHVGSTSSTRQHPLVHLAHCCRAQHSTPSPAGCPGTRRTCTEIPRPGARRRAQRGRLRTLLAAMSTILPTPPPSTILVDAVAKPRICCGVIFGGIDRASRLVTTSISIGPGCLRADLSCARSFLGSVMRTEGRPTPSAIAA